MSGRARLSRSGDFDAVYKKGRSAASRTLVVYTFRHDENTGDVRLGLAVPRRVGDAVTRNNVKRKLREAFADARSELETAHDVVIVARPGVADTLEREDHAWLVDELRSLMEQTLTRNEAAA
jgi:ribonuclease P protein component